MFAVKCSQKSATIQCKSSASVFEKIKSCRHNIQSTWNINQEEPPKIKPVFGRLFKLTLHVYVCVCEYKFETLVTSSMANLLHQLKLSKRNKFKKQNNNKKKYPAYMMQKHN